MNKELLYKNIENALLERGLTKKKAFLSAGVGKNLLYDIRDGKKTELWRVVDLAAYLGVTTSDLVGDAVIHIEPLTLPPPPSALDEVAGQLNEDGQRELLRYAKYLTTNEEYIKSPADKLG